MTSLKIVVLLVVVIVCAVLSRDGGVACLPVEEKMLNEEDSSSEVNVERRATWLETRNLEENFKELVYLSMQELASEGLLNPDLLIGKKIDKRGRHQGFCFRKTKSGRFLPYICWKVFPTSC